MTRELRRRLTVWLLLAPALVLAAQAGRAATAVAPKAGLAASTQLRQSAPLTIKADNETPELIDLMRRRREAVDPVAWAVQMATGVPIAETQIAPGVFARAEASSYDEFTIVWRLAPGVDTDAVKIFRSPAAARMRLAAPEIVANHEKRTQDWLAADDAGVSALPATGVKTAAGSAWTEVRAKANVPFTNFSVTNTNDSGAGSLREALTSANAAVGGAHVINISATGTINLLSALPLIDNISVSINGPGAASLTLNRAAAGSFSVFETPNILYTQAYGFSGMRIQNGSAAFSGGGLRITGGTLTINQCVIANNVGASSGGGLSVVSTTTTITNTTFSGNSAGLQGSAINAQGSALTISNSTFSGNQATATNGGAGAIYHFANGQSMTLTNVTFAGNTSASLFGGGSALVSQNPGSYRNTIFSGQSPQITGSGASSLGNNICSDGSGNLSAAGDLPNTNPLLSALGNYGGQTPTLALLPGSPAINAGTATGAPASDQRGIARVGTTDIGAFESRGFSMALSAGNNQSATVNSAFASPLALTIASANSEPVDGGQVSFTAPGSGPSATLAGNPATIAAGVTASGTVTANGTAGGPYTVAASARGVATGVNFSLTNTAASADVGITKANGTTTSTPGSSTTYTITASNSGPSNAPTATVTDNFPAACTGVTWTCAASGGGSCPPSGSGNISASVGLPVGATAVFSASCSIDSAATGTLVNTATVAAAVTDPNATNNSATDTDALVTPPVLSIADASVVEGNASTTTLNFSLTLTTPAPVGGVRFDIATQDAVATAPSDYLARTLTGQTIAAGQSSASFAVTVNGDTVVEPDEILRVVVSNLTGGATLGDSEAIGTIRTDEFRALSLNDTGKITCIDNTVTPTGTVSPATPDPETAGFNEQDCTRGASAADALGVLYKQGGSSQPGRDFSKIANDGSELPNSATLGSAPGDWACTRDNTTGLIWEVKTDDGGLRDKDHRYTWYEPDANRNGGNAGSTGSDSCASTLPGGLCNIQAYRTAVNALTGGARLCGATDWRLPDLSELHTLIHYGVPISDPSIDITWFPNSISSTGGIHFNGFYWSRETNAKFLNSGWGVYFSPLAVGGFVESFDKTALRHVRLVRGGQ